jgi:anti-sigma B factor antagonist
VIAVPSEYDDVKVLTLKGKLLAAEDVQKLQASVDAELKEGAKKLVLNLKHLNWISSVGIGGLMRCLTRVKDNGSKLRFAGINDKVQNVFSIMKLDTILDMHPDINAAIESF